MSVVAFEGVTGLCPLSWRERQPGSIPAANYNQCKVVLPVTGVVHN